MYLYGSDDNGTPIRPTYSSSTSRLRASLMPSFEEFIALRLLEPVEVVDTVVDEDTQVIELEEVA